MPPNTPALMTVPARDLMAASVALARSGLVRPYRPDRLLRLGSGLLRYGPGPGFGPLAGATFCADTQGIVDDDGAITFGRLEEQCDAVSAGLATLLSPGDRVGLLARNSAGFYQAMVGAARCGLDVLYLNTGFSADQIADIVTERRVQALVHDAEFAAKVPPNVLSIPMTGDAPTSVEQMAASAGRPGARQVAAGRAWQPGPVRRRSRHVMLTSGTTGPPKGVTRTGGAASSAVALLSGLPNRAEQRCLIAAPMFHGWGWLNAMLTMLLRSTIVVTRRFEPERLLQLVERERCQELAAVPTMLRRIMDLPPDVRHRYDTSSLRAVTLSGSALPPALADGFMNEFGDILYSFYGTTEAGYAAVASPADLRTAPGTVGRPLPLVDVRVLGVDGEPCPAGASGMIWVSSHDTRGHAEKPGEGPDRRRRAVSTGDIGWLDEAGRLFIAGRSDDMIITGGENVYPAEVEATLEQHPSVLEAAVVGRRDEVFGQILVAHLTLRDEMKVTHEQLRSWCRDRLAPFQVPRRFVVHDALPHNEAGKVVKRDL